MYLIYYIQNCIIGLAILILIFFNLPGQAGRLPFNQRIFVAVLLSDAALLLLELLTKFSILHTILYPRLLLQVIVVIFYALNPVPLALWVLYLISILHNGKNPTPIQVLFVSLPLFINAGMTLASLRGNFTFFIDPNDVYHRGHYFIVMSLLCYSYLAVYMVLLLKNRKALLKDTFPPLFFFAIPPIAAGILQTLFNGITLVWISLAFSLLIIHLKLQNEQIYTDHLTGLANKRKFDDYLNDLFRSGHPKLIGGIGIDVDNFKKVNDVYGHETGDRILETVGNILHRSVRKKDLVARTGGDEFVILFDTGALSDLQAVAHRIKHRTDQFNERKIYPFPISLSIGYALSDFKPDASSVEFLEHLDRKMYEVKRVNGISTPRSDGN